MHIIYIHISIPVSIHRQDICAQAHTCTHNLFQACSSFFLTLSPSLSHEDSALSCPSQHYIKSWLPWRQDIIRFSFMGSHILLSTHLINAILFCIFSFSKIPYCYIPSKVLTWEISSRTDWASCCLWTETWIQLQGVSIFSQGNPISFLFIVASYGVIILSPHNIIYFKINLVSIKKDKGLSLLPWNLPSVQVAFCLHLLREKNHGQLQGWLSVPLPVC